MKKRMKNMTYMFNMYSKTADGEWDAKDYVPGRKYPNVLRKDSMQYKLQKALEDILGYKGVSVYAISNKPVYGDVYHIIVDVKKDSKLMEAYKKLGFVELW